MSRRLLLLVLSLVIIAAVVVLASSLHNVHFAPGRSVPFETAASGPPPPILSSDTISNTPLWKIVLVWLVFVINLILFIFLMPPEARKRILRQVINFALTALAILLALRYRLIQLPLLASKPVEPTNQTAVRGASSEPLPSFQPPHMAPWWVFLISFLVLAGVLTLLWLAYRWWMRSTSTRSMSDLDAIGAIAESSLGEIAAGRDWGDVIIQSYVRMSEAVSARRGLERAAAMTPREFAGRLEQAGLPAQAVSRLTRLFEAARYGSRASSQADINEAVACLNSILQACGLAQ
ncbi:MAG: DUF4129 domain-containing protein [Bacteroidota bacterium]